MDDAYLPPPSAAPPSPPLKAVLTHEHPDLDAVLCIWLLHRFGDVRYPGIASLPVIFAPAGILPDGLDPEALEQSRGILAVDSGGGRLDTHSRHGVVDEAKRDKSAAWLVASDLGVADMPELKKLLEFVNLQESRGRSISSSHPMDHLVSLPNLLRGLNLIHPHDPARVLEVAKELLDAAFATEVEWFLALQDYQNAQIRPLKPNGRLVAVASDTGAVLKVARMKQADIIIHRNGQGHTGITCRHNGPLASLHLQVLAEVIRAAEAIQEGLTPDYPRLRTLGTAHGWFLHDSGRILSRGSPKNREAPPSQLPLTTLLELCHATLEPAIPMPSAFCAVTRGEPQGCQGCPLQPLQLPTCLQPRDPR